MEEEFESIRSMLRLKYEMQLTSDTFAIFDEFAKKEEVLKSCKYYGRKFRRRGLKRAFTNYKLGTKELDNKIPVYVELPKCEPTSTGHREEKRKKKRKGSKEEVVEEVIHISDVPEEIENTKENVKQLIE